MVNKNSANSLDEIPKKKKKILYKQEHNSNYITYINAMKERNMVILKLLIENLIYLSSQSRHLTLEY